MSGKVDTCKSTRLTRTTMNYPADLRGVYFWTEVNVMAAEPVPLAPAPHTNEIVINCPVCHRTIWAYSVCYHGAVPPPSPEAPKEMPDGDVPEPERRKGPKTRY